MTENIKLNLTEEQANYIVNCIHENVKAYGLDTAQMGLQLALMIRNPPATVQEVPVKEVKEENVKKKSNG